MNFSLLRESKCEGRLLILTELVPIWRPISLNKIQNRGTWWLSSRVLDSRLRGSGFERHWRHCVVLEQETLSSA